MARKLEVFDFEEGYTGKPKYPWDEWLDGSIWKLVNGEDYEGVSTKNLTSTIYNAARARGLKVRQRIRDKGDTIVIQAYEPENEKKPPS